MRARHRRWLRPLIIGLSLFMLLAGACGRKSAVKQTAIARITPEEAKARLDDGEPITFVDSRSAGAWAGAVAKIPGAFRIPPHDIPDDVSEIPKANAVVVYCT